MAGGGQMRPIGEPAQVDGGGIINRRGGDHVANLAEGKPAFAPRPFKATSDELLSANSGGIPGVDFPRRGEEGSFYGQQAGARIPQDMGGTGQMYADPRGPVRRPGAMNDNSPESLAISNSYNQSLNQASPLAPQGNFNVNQAAAGGLQQAMQGTQQAMGYSPAQIQATGYNPTMQSSVGNLQGFGYNAGQLAGSDLSAYENPYEDQVVQNTLRDIGNAQEMSLNQMGAQATQANEFGGSRDRKSVV